MLNSLGLLKQRRFAPLFGTQFLGAFNDNLFKGSMVYLATYEIYHSARAEQNLNAIATGLALLPFFVISALAGQLADTHDKAKIIRIVKTAEIGIMLLGGGGMLVALAGMHALGLGLMLGAVLALGFHSAFFGPIKYAILPQHLEADDVLGGTGLVEAATYLAVLLGQVCAGALPYRYVVLVTLAVAILGRLMSNAVPPAPRLGPKLEINANPITSSWKLVSGTMHIPRLFLAICAISFFWAMGAVLIITFPPLVKNVLTADRFVASVVTAIFSIGIAVGSVVINWLLRGHTSAKYAPAAVMAMAAFVVVFSLLVRAWPVAPPHTLYNWHGFFAIGRAWLVVASLVGIAVTGGMFVVPLYAFLTTTVSKDQTARTVAANNVVNSGAMVVGALVVTALGIVGVTPENMLFVVAAGCPVSAWLAWKLHRACD